MRKRLIDRRSTWKGRSKAPLSISELERRMRPGWASSKGFLGPTESLEAVIAQDNQTLEELGLSHDQIADALEDVLRHALGQRDELFKSDFEEYQRREGIDRSCSHESIFCFSADDLPSVDAGYLVRSTLQVLVNHYRGFQECPWECEHDGGWGSFDFMIVNRQRGQILSCPGLIVHLMRAHHFFEGLESPYRVDPIRAAQVLELVFPGNPGE